MAEGCWDAMFFLFNPKLTLTNIMLLYDNSQRYDDMELTLLAPEEASRISILLVVSLPRGMIN